MLAAIKTESINAENWKSSFLSFTSDWLDEIEKDHPMDSITDISKSLFQKRSQIMGQAALALIEKKFGHLLEQSHCECPLCDRVIKAKPEKGSERNRYGHWVRYALPAIFLLSLLLVWLLSSG